MTWMRKSLTWMILSLLMKLVQMWMIHLLSPKSPPQRPPHQQPVERAQVSCGKQNSRRWVF